jgi:hypothetical protein
MSAGGGVAGSRSMSSRIRRTIVPKFMLYLLG